MRYVYFLPEWVNTFLTWTSASIMKLSTRYFPTMWLFSAKVKTKAFEMGGSFNFVNGIMRSRIRQPISQEVQRVWEIEKKMCSSLPGFEPGTFGLEVQRAIHCATGTLLLKFVHV